MEALAPPKQSERPRRGGVALSRTVDERQLSCREPSNSPEDRSLRAVLESREVRRADLNRAPTMETSARVAEGDSSSEEDFQDSKEDPPPRSLAESITATRVPQVATSQTAQPQPNLIEHHTEQPGTCRVLLRIQVQSRV